MVITLPELTTENLYETLIKTFPELQTDEDDKELLYNVFGFEFNPFLQQALDQHNKDLLKRLFYFLEKMAQSNDDKVRNILGVTILKKLSPQQLDVAFTYMGSHTKKVHTELQVYLKNLFNEDE